MTFGNWDSSLAANLAQIVLLIAGIMIAILMTILFATKVTR